MNTCENGLSTFGILIDLLQAFDPINHRIPISKLKFHGIHAVASRPASFFNYGSKQQWSNLSSSCSRSKIKLCHVASLWKRKPFLRPTISTDNILHSFFRRWGRVSGRQVGAGGRLGHPNAPASISALARRQFAPEQFIYTVDNV